MNNDELKKKIVGIVSNILLSKIMKGKYILKDGDIERIADALIAAGIGDAKEAERKSFVFKNELAFTIHRARAAELVAKTAAETGILKYEEMKHRAEVAERAVHFLVYDNSEYTYDDAIEQAEKELSEEEKLKYDK